MGKPRKPADVEEGVSYRAPKVTRRVVSVKRMQRHHRYRTLEGQDVRGELRGVWIVSYSNGERVRHISIQGWRKWDRRNRTTAWRL